jgi:ATP-dependent DNA helicase 2 subunit 2
MMAAKEATVYIVDCGATMAERSHGRKQTNLEYALEYVWDRITATVATGRKTAMAGVIGLRTNQTKNPLEAEAEYANITVFRDIDQILMPHVRRLRGDLVVSSTESGDAISALIVAIHMISTKCKQLKYDRKIVLVTDARAPMQADDMAGITSKMKEDGIKLVILGVDFDDADYGFKEECKDVTKAENEAILKQLCEDCDGAYGTLTQAVDELGIPRVKSTKPTPNYKGYLTLGNPEEYDTALAIDVERYPKAMLATAPTASKFVIKSDHSASQVTQETMEDGDDAANGPNENLAAVRSALNYQVDDESAPGGKRDIPRDELAKGYEYGRTAVHISESDRNVTTYETTPGLDIIGFVDKRQYERYLDMHRGNLTIAQRSNDKASMALSSFIHALYELESYAVARLVPKENKEPRILLMAPHIEADFECLYDVELPFAEDLRSYKFPPLDRVLLVSGREIKVHRNLPGDDLQHAMSDYVDSMDLSSFGRADDGEPTEYMPMDETYAPMLHRLHQVIKHRAVYPDAEPPPPYEISTRYSRPPDELVKRSEEALQRLVEASDVKKVPPKARGRRLGKRREQPKPLSNLDVNALLAQDPRRKSKRIDPKNAVAEFKQHMEAAQEEDDPQVIPNLVRQMKTIIFDWIRHSVGDRNYQTVVAAVSTMREELLEMEEPQLFNDFMKELKARLLSEELGGSRSDMWYALRSARLYLLQDKDFANNIDDYGKIAGTATLEEYEAFKAAK